MKQNRTGIFIHGAGGGGWEWLIWQRVFTARGWSVLAPDLMPVATGIAATRFDDYAAQVRSWCDAVAGPKVLIGASLGGLLALHACAQAPADGLVLINPLPPAGIDHNAARRGYPAVVAWRSERSLASTRRAMPDADDAACFHAFARWRDESGLVLNDASTGIHVEIPECRVLVLAGELDSDVEPMASRRLAERIKAEFRIVRGASHVGPLLGRGASRIANSTADWCDEVIRVESLR